MNDLHATVWAKKRLVEELVRISPAQEGNALWNYRGYLNGHSLADLSARKQRILDELAVKTMPRRIQLSRWRGFNLQEFSLAVNGLPAVSCARPSKYGNPHKIGFCSVCGVNHTRDEALAEFATDVRIMWDFLFEELRGKNLACWCKLTEKCHCDLLLVKANK